MIDATRAMHKARTDRYVEGMTMRSRLLSRVQNRAMEVMTDPAEPAARREKWTRVALACAYGASFARVAEILRSGPSHPFKLHLSHNKDQL